jgi:hypothetical protein
MSAHLYLIVSVTVGVGQQWTDVDMFHGGQRLLQDQTTLAIGWRSLGVEPDSLGKHWISVHIGEVADVVPDKGSHTRAMWGAICIAAQKGCSG